MCSLSTYKTGYIVLMLTCLCFGQYSYVNASINRILANTRIELWKYIKSNDQALNPLCS